MVSTGSGNGSNVTSGQPPTSDGAQSAHAVSVNTEYLERFTRSFEISARRWELVVYPSLFAFIVLAAYGFFLVYSLTKDVAHLSKSITQMTVAVDSMSENMGTVSNRMQAVSLYMDDIAHKMDALEPILWAMSSMYRDDIAHKMDALEPMRVTMENIDRSAQVMSVSTNVMRYNMTDLNHQMAGMNHGMSPLRTMGSFLPFR